MLSGPRSRSSSALLGSVLGRGLRCSLPPFGSLPEPVSSERLRCPSAVSTLRCPRCRALGANRLEDAFCVARCRGSGSGTPAGLVGHERGISRPPHPAAASSRRDLATNHHPPAIRADADFSGLTPSASSSAKPARPQEASSSDTSLFAGSDAPAIAALLSSSPKLCREIAASVDASTAARLATEFSGAASGEGSHTQDGCTSGGDVPRPTVLQLWQLTVRTAVPFVGFGFFDNTIMLTVGETLDVTLGVAFGFSTLAAAGMGQMVSDASGVTLQGIIERFADRLGLPNPRLTSAQQQLSFVRTWMIGARIVGIVLGCALGMFPLLLMPEKRPRLVDQIAEKLSPEQRRELQQLVKSLSFKKGEKLLEWGQTSANVYMVQSGQVDVIGRDVDGIPFPVCTMGPGHAFGIPALMAPSHVDLIARDDEVVVSAIAKDDFLRLTGKAGMEVFENARSVEHAVYLRSQGSHMGWKSDRGTGKTRYFASLTPEQKLQVLAATGLEDASQFQGTLKEGKVRFFANLPEEIKREALERWQSQTLRKVKKPSPALEGSEVA